ncbi:MAG TPA: FxsA family protein [Dongiaceae bacterium]|nr:FxsA family protein [Dongiaceae bacterium]
MIVLTALALPFLEIAGFVWLGGKLGVALTLIWVIGAMVAGLALLRHTGLQAVGRLRAALAEGKEPGRSIIDAACFAAAAMLLIIPGFVSDALALILMLPVTRHWLLRRTAAHFEARVYRGTGVIHGEFTVVPEADDDAAQDGSKPRPIKDDRKIIDVE